MSTEPKQPCQNSECPAGGLEFVFFEWADDMQDLGIPQMWAISTGDDYSGRVYAIHCPYCGHKLLPPDGAPKKLRPASNGNTKEDG